MIFQQYDIVATSLITFIFSILVVGGISFFYIRISDKIQMGKHKNLLALAGSSFGIIYFMILYFNFPELLIEGFFFHLVFTLFVSIIIGSIIKRITYKGKIIDNLELEVLEPGKDLLEVRNLKVYYPLLGGLLKRQKGWVKAVDGVSFKIRTGETLGLVGESGCGKTTIAKTILGIISKESGDIIFKGKPVPDEYPIELRRKIQIIFQDPDASLNPRMKVVNIIGEPLKNLLGIVDKEEIRSKALELLRQVSLKKEHLDRYPHEFSGGQKQRICIARALACNPDLIILDEPTSALDVSVQAQILNLLKDLQKQYHYGFLFITHDLSVEHHIADRVAIMYLGKIVEIGKTEEIFLNPVHPYTKALLLSHPRIEPENQEINFILKGEVPSPINPPSGCYFHTRCFKMRKSKDCDKITPKKVKVNEDHFVWCGIKEEIN